MDYLCSKLILIYDKQIIVLHNCFSKCSKNPTTYTGAQKAPLYIHNVLIDVSYTTLPVGEPVPVGPSVTT